MAFEEKHREIIDSHLYLDDLGDDGQTLALEFNKRQVRLLLDAIDHYKETRCPMSVGQGECAMLFWSEDIHTGAIERACSGSCTGLLDSIITTRIPAAFSPRANPKEKKGKRAR